MENPFALRESFVLTCPICYDSYNEEDRYPMLLCSNQHHCCLNCLLYFFADRPPLTAIPCPNCREPFTLERSNRFRLLREFNQSVVEISEKTSQQRQILVKLRDEKHELVKELERQKQITEVISAEFMREKGRSREKGLGENDGRGRAGVGKSFMVETMAESRRTARKRQPGQKEEEFTAWRNCDSTYSVYFAEEGQSALKPKRNYNPPVVAYSKQMRSCRNSKNEKKSSESVKRMPTKASVRDTQKVRPSPKPLKTRRNVSVYSKSQGQPLPYFILDAKHMDCDKLKRIGTLQRYENRLPLRHMAVNILTRYNFNHLLTLDLSKMQLTNMHLTLLEGGNYFPQLKVVDLAHNRVRSLPLFLVGCRKVRRLDLSYNLMEGIDPKIGKMVNLKELILWNNRIADVPVEMGLLSQLEWIDLSNNRLLEHPQVLTTMKRLQRVDLFGCFAQRST